MRQSADSPLQLGEARAHGCMALINFIFNLAGLAFWINWLTSRTDPLARTSAASLAGTLKRTQAQTRRRWQHLAGLAALLLVRAWLCLQFSSLARWTPGIRLGVIVLSFRAELPWHMLMFSLLSFGAVLAGFYLWLLLFSILNGLELDANPVQKLVRLHLGRCERLPRTVQLLLPFALGGFAWLALYPLLAWMAVLPPARSVALLLMQAGVLGAGSYLAWKYAVLIVLLLHLLHSYVHLGGHPLWEFVDVSARNLLRPLGRLPLRAGRIDFAPVLGLALVVLALICLEHPPERVRVWFSRWLPF